MSRFYQLIFTAAHVRQTQTLFKLGVYYEKMGDKGNA